MGDDTLLAFYDLQIAPASYDFVVFLALAELARRRGKHAALHVVILPGPEGGFRDQDTVYDSYSKHWRLQNILIPACAVMPHRIGLTVCRTRAEAKEIEHNHRGPVFPEAYRIDAPRADFLWSGVAAAAARGEEIPRLRATEQATIYMRDWLAHNADKRRVVTITLRETRYTQVRNSNLAAWTAFARGLDPDLYCPIIVRDTDTVFDASPPTLDALTFCPPASLNLDLRLALYEQSWLNMLIPNGPGVLCWLSDRARFIMFKMLGENWTNTSMVFLASNGLKPSGQLSCATRFQRLVWEADEPDVIAREFAAMAERIGESGEAVPVESEPVAAEDPMELALRLHTTGRLEEAVSLYQQIVQTDPDNADAWHMLGLIANEAERPEAAERMIRRAVALKDDRAHYYVNLSAVLRRLDRGEEAMNCLWRAIALDPKDGGAHGDLAEMLLQQGQTEKAAAAMAKAIRLRPDSVALHERAAKLFEEVGRAADALRLYRHAIDLREHLRRRNQEATSHLPEVPRVAPMGR